MATKTTVIPDIRRITLRLEACCDTPSDVKVGFTEVIRSLGNLILAG